jgi:hypothetical protein
VIGLVLAIKNQSHIFLNEAPRKFRIAESISADSQAGGKLAFNLNHKDRRRQRSCSGLFPIA